jgi:O-acetyl-ADP-ribose deacetylase (regulator of RNase III)
MAELRINHTAILPVLGELALQEVDALIHPTNNYLWFSPGYSEEIKKRGGEALENEALQLGPIEVGTAVLSSAGQLPCRFLIHAAAWGQDMMTNQFKVRQAVLAALQTASGQDCQSAALPPVGAGIGGFSMAASIEATFLAIVEHCLHSTSLKRIYFLAKDQAEEKILANLIQSANDANPSSDIHYY